MSKTQKVKVTAIVPVEVIDEAQTLGATITHQVEMVTITTASEEQCAYEMLKNVATATKTIEKKRKAITGPLNASLKEVNGMFKTLGAPFKEADRAIRNKIMLFRQAEEEKAEKESKKREEEAEKERARREKIQAAHAAKGHKTTELAEVEVEEVVPVVATTTTTVKRWVFEVKDVKKIPDEYFVLDEVAINQVIRDGVRAIAGLRIYQKESIRL